VKIPDHAHVMQCELNRCVVCDDKLHELREYWDWVWLEIVTHTEYPNPDNETLEKYQ